MFAISPFCQGYLYTMVLLPLTWTIKNSARIKYTSLYTIYKEAQWWQNVCQYQAQPASAKEKRFYNTGPWWRLELRFLMSSSKSSISSLSAYFSKASSDMWSSSGQSWNRRRQMTLNRFYLLNSALVVRCSFFVFRDGFFIFHYRFFIFHYGFIIFPYGFIIFHYEF